VINMQTRYKINTPDVIYENVDNEVLIIEFNTGNYYSLNNSGADIWELLAAGTTEARIIQIIGKKYNSGNEEVQPAVDNLINELVEEKLIVPIKTEGNDAVNSVEMDISPPSIDLAFESPTLQKFSDMQELLLLDPIHEVDETGWPAPKKD